MAESEFADHQTSRTAPETSAAECTFSRVRCCPAKLAAAPSSSTADERTANGGDNGAIALATFSIAVLSPEATASTRSPDSATPGGTGRPWRAASPSPTALDPNSDLSLALLKGTALFTVTPSAEHGDCAGIAVNANPDAVGDALGGFARSDDAGDSVFTRDDRRMRKEAAVVGDDAAEEREQDVERLGGRLGDEDVALEDSAEFGRPGHAPRSPLVDSRARSETVEHLLLVLRLGATEDFGQRNEGGAHDAGGGGG